MSSTPSNSAGSARAGAAESHAYEPPKPSWKADAVGDDRARDVKNISWGAIIAGVVTFLAVTLLLSLITAAVGLSGSGIGAGIWSIVTLVLALAAGGYVAGALAGRAGLIHGFLTWATSLLAAVVLAGLLVGNILGAAGNILGSAASTVTGAVAQNPDQAASLAPDVSEGEASQAAQEAQEAVESAAPQVQQAAGEAADTAQSAAWWTFAGLLIGAIIAALAGLLGSRSVSHDPSRDRELRTSRG